MKCVSGMFEVIQSELAIRMEIEYSRYERVAHPFGCWPNIEMRLARTVVKWFARIIRRTQFMVHVAGHSVELAEQVLLSQF